MAPNDSKIIITIKKLSFFTQTFLIQITNAPQCVVKICSDFNYDKIDKKHTQ